jgi:ABC-type enterochelin transport system permease subunit
MEFNKVMKIPLFLLGLACGVIVISVGMITVVLGQQQINVSELDTLDRMRYTAIQMTLLSIQTENPTNMTSDEIASEIFMLTNTTPKRPTTLEIEQMYMNLTQ